MPRLISSALSLRRADGRILKLPPYVSLLCIVVGIVWLLLLPLDGYSRRTYISENALLPGQVHTYFGGSDQNVFRAFRRELAALGNSSNVEINDVLEGIFTGMGLKAARQNYTYVSSGRTYAGQNAYAILQAPRGDATEALVLVAAWRDVDGRPNRTGVALLLTLARYFRRWSLWSKDIVFLVPPDSRAGPQAWVDAYHDSHDRVRVASLPLKSGALQGAVAIDYARQVREDEAGDVGTWASTHFASVHVVYDGVNGQLPNLDLVNSIVNIAGGQMGMGSAIQGMYAIPDGRSVFEDRLRTMARGMLNQGLGQATGPHSCFIPYHVDAVTIQPFGEGGWHDEMGMGRLVEGTFRSLNNLLEHLHQSFFFYLLMGRDRFVSIGTYLPAAMLVAANFTVMAIALWVRSGHVDDEPATAVSGDEKSSRNAGREKPSTERPAGETAPRLVERDLFLPIGVVAAAHFLGVLPLYLFNHLQASMLATAFVAFSLLSLALPVALATLLTRTYGLTLQQHRLTKSFSLLLLGMFLSSLATLNFSLAFLVGLLASPLTFVVAPPPASPPSSASPSLVSKVGWWLSLVTCVVASPTTIVAAAAEYSGFGLAHLLAEAAFGWDVWRMYTAVVVWCVWWPAWLVGATLVLSRPAGVVGTPAKEKRAA